MFSEPTLYDDPDKIPLFNGPVRAVTPPHASTYLARAAQNQLISEFLVPFPMHLADQNDWPVLQVPFKNSSVLLLKPLTALGTFEAVGRLGNESPEAYCSMFRVVSGPEVSPDDMPAMWDLLETMLLWIRVRARHYWLLHGSTGYGALNRGSILGSGRQINFVLAGSGVIVRPLSKTMWISIGGDLRRQSRPPLSEAIFCDGLLSIVARDEMKAFLELGVACEVEVTQLLDMAATTGSTTPDKQQYAKKGERDPFSVKLKTWTSRLGLDDVATVQLPGTPPDWVDFVVDLYNMRNGVAHSGKKRSGQSVQAYMFAANALFRYSQTQRKLLQSLPYDYEEVDDPTRQVIAFSDAVAKFVAE